MGILLRESKRDEMLMGYYNALVQSGIEVSFGQFKSKLLQTLASGAGIHSLSQRSNYYLAGAAKYYFNGDLTNNRPVVMTKPQAWEEGEIILDEWKDDVCKRLDACIKILRNAYIDSVGTTFEQPEDFGTLPIAKLLRKYNKQINKVLGIVTPKKAKEVPQIDDNPNVGNNYTFEIMYSQADCQKYERPTAPGSWCITYGQNHYNYYVKHLGIHYVIFRQNGWEDIPRPTDPLNEPGFTTEKPHDKYGNSLIALLQSNKSPEPIYITSRWNHGREVSCEADHAYTKEEFEQITGVTDDDLQRIYDIWKQNKPSTSGNGDNGGAKTREEQKEVVREIKYIQMRINGGENPNQFLKKQITIVGKDDQPVKNCVSVCRVFANVSTHPNVNEYKFLVDRGKIIYDTITKCSWPLVSSSNNLIFLRMSSYNKEVGFVYDLRRHSLVTVDGVHRFMSVVSWNGAESQKFCTVNRSAREHAIINVETGQPVQLPNGEYWVNEIKTSSWDWRSQRGKDGARWLPEDMVIMIIYDESSGEKYLFDTKFKKFLPNPVTEDTENICNFNLKETYNDKVVSLYYNEFGPINKRGCLLLNRQTGEKFDFGLENPVFYSIYPLNSNLFAFEQFDYAKENDNSVSPYSLFFGNTETNELLRDKNGNLIGSSNIMLVQKGYYEQRTSKYFMFIVGEEKIHNGEMKEFLMKILNKETLELLVNPYHTEEDETVFRIIARNKYDTDVFTANTLINLVTNKNGDIEKEVDIESLANQK